MRRRRLGSGGGGGGGGGGTLSADFDDAASSGGDSDRDNDIDSSFFVTTGSGPPPRKSSQNPTVTLSGLPDRAFYAHHEDVEEDGEEWQEEALKDMPAVPAIPSYTDARPKVMTYFKIFSPSRGGRMCSVYESAPDGFNFSQSWGWKSSSLVLDDGMESVGTGNGSGSGSGSGNGLGSQEDGKGAGKLRFTVSDCWYLREPEINADGRVTSIGCTWACVGWCRLSLYCNGLEKECGWRTDGHDLLLGNVLWTEHSSLAHKLLTLQSDIFTLFPLSLSLYLNRF
jgi:hypothetical protein